MDKAFKEKERRAEESRKKASEDAKSTKMLKKELKDLQDKIITKDE